MREKSERDKALKDIPIYTNSNYIHNKTEKGKNVTVVHLNKAETAQNLTAVDVTAQTKDSAAVPAQLSGRSIWIHPQWMTAPFS